MVKPDASERPPRASIEFEKTTTFARLQSGSTVSRISGSSFTAPT